MDKKKQPASLRRLERMGSAGSDDIVNVVDLIQIDERVGQDIKGLRKARSVTLSRLSDQTNLSQGYLSQIERGLSKPSVKALHSISRALGVNISWFFPRSETEDEDLRDYVVRSNGRRRLTFSNGVVDELLSPSLEGQLEMLRCTFPPGTNSGEAAYSHIGEEAGIVLAGTLDLWINENHIVLNEGDSFSFLRSTPHRYANTGERETIVIWAITPPSY